MSEEAIGRRAAEFTVKLQGAPVAVVMDQTAKLIREVEAAAHRRGWDQAIEAAAKRDDIRATLERLCSVIDAAGIGNLSNGVQLGQMSWMMKCEDAMADARSALAHALAYPGPESK